MLNDDGLGPDPDPTESVNNLNKTIRWYASGAWSNLLPFGAVLFNDYTLSGDGSLNLNYTAMAATRYGGLWLTTVEPGSNISVFQVAYPDIDRRGNVINMINEAAGSLFDIGPQVPIFDLFFYLANALVEGSGRNVTIQTFTQGQPQRALFSFDLSSIAGLFTYGFVLSLLMPVFMANLVTDKQERVLLMMQMSGLRMWIYWLVAYIYDLTLYSLIAGSVYITSFIFQMRMFTQSRSGRPRINLEIIFLIVRFPRQCLVVDHHVPAVGPRHDRALLLPVHALFASAHSLRRRLSDRHRRHRRLEPPQQQRLPRRIAPALVYDLSALCLLPRRLHHGGRLHRSGLLPAQRPLCRPLSSLGECNLTFLFPCRTPSSRRSFGSSSARPSS